MASAPPPPDENAPAGPLLAIGGADGVASMINILRREFEMAMALSGRTKISDIDR